MSQIAFSCRCMNVRIDLFRYDDEEEEEEDERPPPYSALQEYLDRFKLLRTPDGAYILKELEKRVSH